MFIVACSHTTAFSVMASLFFTYVTITVFDNVIHTHTSHTCTHCAHCYTCRTDSMYDYVYSPGHSVSGDTDNLDAEELTEPSTPSSHPTPDINGSTLSGICDNVTAAAAATTADPQPRSATLPDMLVTMPSYDTSTLPSQQTSDVLSPKMSTSLPRQPFSFADEKEPPPLPPRDTAAMGTLKKNKTTTQSQPFLDKTTKLPGTLKRESEVRRLSNSMDCLLLPEEDSETSQSGTSFSKLEAEPYLRPSEVKRVMDGDSRNASIFMSMRVSGKSRPVLPTFQDSVDSPESMKRSKSFERGHKRSQSNPFILDLLISKAVPPELPPRNTDLPPPVPSRRSPQHRSSRSPPPLPPPGNEETVESSLEFGNAVSGGRVSVVSRISRTRSPQAVVRDLKEHTFNTNADEDNVSTISGPFEEIDAEQPSSVGDQSVGGGITRDVSSHTLPPQQVNDDDDDEDNDQYARIEDITRDQQYIAMAPAPANMKGATLPAQKGSYLSGDDLEEEEVGGGKRGRSMSQATAPTTPKKDSGVLARTVRRFRKPRTEPAVRESTDSPSPPPPPAHNFSSSILSSPNRHTLPRPLPPSPTKAIKSHFNGATRKPSSGSGSNIYETIDEDLLSRVMGKRRQATTKDDNLKASLALPVSPSMVSKYLQVVQKFFSLPEIQAKWVETVREVMPDEDAEDIPPPYYNTGNNKHEQQQHNLSHIRSGSGHHDDDQIPVAVPQGSSTPVNKSLPAGSSSLALSPSSPFQSPRHTVMVKTAAVGSSITSSPLIKRQASRDGLIEMMNQQLRHQESSDSESDSDEEAGAEESSDSESSDSDIEQSEQLQHHKQATTAENVDHTHHLPHTNHINHIDHTDETDLDEALGMRNSMSTDSDHIETDPIVKSSQSASVEGLELDEKGVGVVEDHGVQPLHFPSKVDQKSGGDLKVASGSRTLSDSGISNQENIQSETEC